MPRRILGLALVLALLPLRAPSIARAEGDPAPGIVVTDVDAALARTDINSSARVRLELYRLINQTRADSGLPPYALDDRLTASADEHATDMAVQRFCRHTGSDGSTSRSRMARHGYPFNNWAGENIICSRWTPESAMQWWMASTPHRHNILHGHYTHIGIGYNPNGRYGPDWTLNFAAGASDTVVPAFASPAVLQSPAGARAN